MASFTRHKRGQREGERWTGASSVEERADDMRDEKLYTIENEVRHAILLSNIRYGFFLFLMSGIFPVFLLSLLCHSLPRGLCNSGPANNKRKREGSGRSYQLSSLEGDFRRF